jgi:hypothetical protein
VPPVPDESWAPLRDELAADVRRVSDRLRTLSATRLAAPVPPFDSRADAAQEAARVLAVAAQGVEDRASAAEPAWRTPQRLADLAAGDQVAVQGHDLLAVLARVDPADEVWAPGSRRTAREVVLGAAETLAATRRLL